MSGGGLNLRPAPADTLGMLRNERGMETATVGIALAAVVLVGIAGFAAMATFRHHTAAAPSPVPSVTESVQYGIPDANEADDALTQTDLRNATVAAKTYFLDHNSYVGFSPGAAARIEPGLRYNVAPAAVRGQVSIRGATAQSVALVERSPTGAVFCLADQSGTVTYGRVDAPTAAACQGGW
jgi:hypothetical protein